MSSNGYKFVGCQHCWERDNITYNDEYAGREFARRVTETGYRNGEQSISFDSDCEIENEGEADFDGSDFESSDDGWDYGEITCNYCGYEVSSYYKTNLIALWQDDDHETIVEYNAQDDEDDEDEAVTIEDAPVVRVNNPSNEAIDLVAAISSVTQDVTDGPDAPEITLAFTQ